MLLSVPSVETLASLKARAARTLGVGLEDVGLADPAAHPQSDAALDACLDETAGDLFGEGSHGVVHDLALLVRDEGTGALPALCPAGAATAAAGARAPAARPPPPPPPPPVRTYGHRLSSPLAGTTIAGGCYDPAPFARVAAAAAAPFPVPTLPLPMVGSMHGFGSTGHPASPPAPPLAAGMLVLNPPVGGTAGLDALPYRPPAVRASPTPTHRSFGGYGYGRHGGAASSFVDADVVHPAYSGGTVPQGVAGLINLGNTCYMASAVQCLARAPPLARSFVHPAAGWRADLNATNPLGCGGDLAIAFAGLARALWAGNTSSIAPRGFKAALAKFAPQFRGFAQQDAQELASFLLDGVHEDLNRVKVKPYSEDPTGATPSEAAAAAAGDGAAGTAISARAWAAHKARNDSVVVDACHGQLQSTLTCPACGTSSVAADPFSVLSVPLPVLPKRPLPLGLGFFNTNPARKQASRPVLAPPLPLPPPPPGTLRVVVVAGVVGTTCAAAEAPLLSWLPSPRVVSVGPPLPPNAAGLRSALAASLGVPPASPHHLVLAELAAATGAGGRAPRLVVDGAVLPAGGGGPPPLVAYAFATHPPPGAVPVFIVHGGDSVGHALSVPLLIYLPAPEVGGSGAVLEPASGAGRAAAAAVRCLLTPAAPPPTIKAGTAPIASGGDGVSMDEGGASPRIGAVPGTPQPPAGGGGASSFAPPSPPRRGGCESVSPRDGLRGTTPDEPCEGGPPDGVAASSLPPPPPPPLPPGGLTLRWARRDEAVRACGFARIGHALAAPPAVILAVWGGGCAPPQLPPSPPAGGAGGAVAAAVPAPHLPAAPAAATPPPPAPSNRPLTLDACLDAFLAPETLAPGDEWTCPGCKAAVRATKRLALWRLPPLVVIHLKRFAASRAWRDKLDVGVAYPVRGLDLRARMPPAAAAADAAVFGTGYGGAPCRGAEAEAEGAGAHLFDLCGVVNHFGGLGGGHYTAVSSVPGAGWYEFDDARATPVKPGDAQSAAGYLLFYRRRGGPGGGDAGLPPPRAAPGGAAAAATAHGGGGGGGGGGGAFPAHPPAPLSLLRPASTALAGAPAGLAVVPVAASDVGAEGGFGGAGDLDLHLGGDGSDGDDRGGASAMDATYTACMADDEDDDGGSSGGSGGSGASGAGRNQGGSRRPWHPEGGMEAGEEEEGCGEGGGAAGGGLYVGQGWV